VSALSHDAATDARPCARQSNDAAAIVAIKVEVFIFVVKSQE
jgi:hypothetical protein